MAFLEVKGKGKKKKKNKSESSPPIQGHDLILCHPVSSQDVACSLN